MMNSELYKYIQKPDDAYSWVIDSTQECNGVNIYIIKLTSQKWLTDKCTNVSIWKHEMHVYVPETVSSDTILLRVSSDSKQQPKLDKILLQTVQTTQSIAAKLFDIPNQPVIFYADESHKERIEDDAMSYSWKLYCESTPLNPELLINFPMVKSVVKAMDTLNDFSNKQNDYVLMGASKRGLTVWLTSAIDKRVKGIMPLVFDALNLGKTLSRQPEIYGKHGDALDDYEKCGLLNHHSLELLKIIDPYTYLPHITIPKYLINSTGDKYFLPDSSQLYFGDIVGPKYLCYTPNSDHNLRKLNADNIITFFGSIMHNYQLSHFSWGIKDNIITLKLDTLPSQIKLWQAVNPVSRDFRSTTDNPQWTSQILNHKIGFSEYTPKLEFGWNGYFIELIYSDLIYTNKSISFTTNINIVYSDQI